MKSVLFVAYAFPPCGGAGVQRTAKFARYLPEYGWLPTVLSVEPSCYGVTDASHLSELSSEIEIIRTPHFEPVTRYSRSKNGGNTNNGDGAESTTAAPAPSRWHRALRAIGKHGWRALQKSIFIPDDAIIWYPRAVKAALAANARRRFDLIYATGEPYTDFLIATTVSQMTGAPFVVDMRDPWTLATYRSDTGARARRTVERWQERRVLERCRACVFANRSLDLYSETYPQWKDKFEYIPNGHDPSDFEGIDAKRFDKFTIVHTGTFLSRYRTADTFLRALRKVLDARPEIEDRIQVLFVGKIGEEQELIRELSLTSVTVQTGYLPHKESIAYLKGADLLLLVGGEQRWEETGKIYEYFAVRKPVLALVNPDGSAADLLRRCPIARIVDRLSVCEAAAAIMQAFDGAANTDAEPDSSWTAQFERRSLTARLAQLFDKCV